jgi:F-type H+-transporting ATPase subunit b
MRHFRDMRDLVWGILPVLLSMPAMAEEGEKGGLPQLDTSLFPEQLFWLAVSFTLLYVLMSGVALPRVAKTQTNRKSVIASELQAAKTANESANATVAKVEKSLAEARAKAQATMSEMVAKVTEESTLRQTAQERELARHLHAAEEGIAVVREAALASVRSSAKDLAAVVVDKVVGAKVRVSA